MQNSTLRDQRGVAMILEVILVVVLVGAAGYVGFNYYQARHQASPTTNTAAAVPSNATTPNGKVSNAGNALNAEATAESQDSSAEGSSVQSVDSTSSSAANVGGSYNENQF